ncbi:MAG: hypothetical protein NZ522_02990, partial [Chitinophagales bacterium]|nr:hypothetical protein [Chitinophagales bacterium]
RRGAEGAGACAYPVAAGPLGGRDPVRCEGRGRRGHPLKQFNKDSSLILSELPIVTKTRIFRKYNKPVKA